jgi:hypothetical protein
VRLAASDFIIAELVTKQDLTLALGADFAAHRWLGARLFLAVGALAAILREPTAACRWPKRA